MNPISYHDFTRSYLDQFKQYSQKQFLNLNPNVLYDPIRYVMGMGGKRFRPVCLLLTHHLYNQEWKKSLPVAYTVELFHNFTLLHDDIMDHSTTRRGHETVHIKYDVNSAILSGDNMLIYCYKYLYDQIEDPGLAQKLGKILTENGIRVCEGQAMDVEFEDRSDVSESEYILMIQYKTAVLIGAAFQMGALMGGANEQDALNLFQFGLHMGTSFQIIDDILDTYGDESFGKKIGGDILQGKKTLLYILCRDHANQKDQSKLMDLYADQQLESEQKLKDVHALFSKYDVKSSCVEVLEAYSKRARQDLEKLTVDIQPLETLTDIMLRRNY